MMMKGEGSEGGQKSQKIDDVFYDRTLWTLLLYHGQSGHSGSN